MISQKSLATLGSQTCFSFAETKELKEQKKLSDKQDANVIKLEDTPIDPCWKFPLESFGTYCGRKAMVNVGSWGPIIRDTVCPCSREIRDMLKARWRCSREESQARKDD